jgi:hypothetical protein
LVNTDYSFIPVAKDDDNDLLTYSITNKPSWAKFDTSTGKLRRVATIESIYSDITISVTDGLNFSSLPLFDINVIQLFVQVTIEWDKPTTNEDETPLDNISGYEISYGTESKKYDNNIYIDSGNILTAVIDDLDAGEYFFSLMNRTTAKNNSNYAAEVSL